MKRGIMLPTDKQYLAALRDKAESEPENQELAKLEAASHADLAKHFRASYTAHLPKKLWY